MAVKLKKIKLISSHCLGFTLLEMLISMSIFIILLMSLTSIYIFSEKNLTMVEGREEVINEARLLLERVAQDIRLNTLDYSDEWPSMSGDIELRLINNQGEKIRYQIRGDSCPPDMIDCLLRGTVDDYGMVNWSVVNSRMLQLSEGGFYFYPFINPFVDGNDDGFYDSNIQPRVTLFFNFKLIDPPPVTPEVVSLQTTVSSRVYKR